MKSEIITLPNQILRQPSQKVGLIDDSIKVLIDSMNKQAKLWEADKEHEITVGLAAVQINNPLKVIIIRDNFDPKLEAQFDVFINPKIIKKIGPITTQTEGCLSVPNYYCNVERHEIVKVEALDINGNVLRLKAQGFLARIFQHEIDHLRGVTIVDEAVTSTNEQGQTFKFCKLGDDNKFIPVNESELANKGLL